MKLNEMKPARILVVEDDLNVAQVLRARLESYGFEVCDIVSSGLDAIRVAETLTLDIVIMDIKIKGRIDGIETARRIRSRIEIPIVYLTAHSDEDLLKRAQKTEPFGYIIKPYDGKQLCVTVEMSLSRHRLDLERKQLLSDLSETLAKIKQLSGLLPICSSCKKIRDDKGYWNQVEDYIKKHAEVEFTHGLCPDCACKLYPEYYKPKAKE